MKNYKFCKLKNTLSLGTKNLNFLLMQKLQKQKWVKVLKPMLSFAL